MSDDERKRIAIVGCGAAGMTCLDQIMKNKEIDMDIDLYDRQSNVGGAASEFARFKDGSAMDWAVIVYTEKYRHLFEYLDEYNIEKVEADFGFEFEWEGEIVDIQEPYSGDSATIKQYFKDMETFATALVALKRVEDYTNPLAIMEQLLNIHLGELLFSQIHLQNLSSKDRDKTKDVSRSWHRLMNYYTGANVANLAGINQGSVNHYISPFLANIVVGVNAMDKSALASAFIFENFISAGDAPKTYQIKGGIFQLWNGIYNKYKDSSGVEFHLNTKVDRIKTRNGETLLKAIDGSGNETWRKYDHVITCCSPTVLSNIHETTSYLETYVLREFKSVRLAAALHTANDEVYGTDASGLVINQLSFYKDSNLGWATDHPFDYYVNMAACKQPGNESVNPLNGILWRQATSASEIEWPMSEDKIEDVRYWEEVDDSRVDTFTSQFLMPTLINHIQTDVIYGGGWSLGKNAHETAILSGKNIAQRLLKIIE